LLIMPLALITSLWIWKSSLTAFLWTMSKMLLLLGLLGSLLFAIPGSGLKFGLERFRATDNLLAVIKQDQDLELKDIERSIMFYEAYNRYLDHPFLGIGYDNIGVVTEVDFNDKIVSHNILITLLSECG